MGKIHCADCKKSCKGQAVRLQDKYFHVKCFKCRECKKQLAAGGFYAKDEKYYCADDYQKLFGTQCFACGKYVEGEVVTALGNTYHQDCFHCTKCRAKFGPGDKVTFNGKDYLCNKCLEQFEAAKAASPSKGSPNHVGDKENAAPFRRGIPTTSTPARPEQIVVDGYLSSPVSDMSDMSGDSKVLSPRGQSNGPRGRPSPSPSPGPHQFLGFSPISTASSRGSTPRRVPSPTGPYAEQNNPFKEYFAPSGVTDKHHSGEDKRESTHNNRDSSYSEVFDEELLMPPQTTAEHKDRLSPIQQIMQYRSPSPHSTISRSSHKSRESSGSYEPKHDVDYGRFYNQSYLKLDDPSHAFKKGAPAAPRAMPRSPHFHRPENFSYTQVKRDFIRPITKDSSMMSTLGDQRYMAKKTQLEDLIPLGKEEMIRMAKYPDAMKNENKPAPIERDDWPAPPEPAVAYPELLRAHPMGHGKAKSQEEIQKEQEEKVDPKIKREIEELAKIQDSGVGKVIMKDLEKKRSESPTLDPRSASRTPSAKHEPPYKTRYISPIFASPSRDLDYRPRLHSMDDLFLGKKYRTSTLPISNFPTPRPGYGLRTKAMPGRARDGYDGYMSEPDYRYRGYMSEPDYRAHRHDSSDAMERRSYHTSQSSMEEFDPETGLRRSRFRSTATPDNTFHTPFLAYRGSIPSILRPEEPPKIYTYEQLKITNYQLPPGVDRNTIERHLSKDEFESIFHMSREDFYRLAEWKRNDLKRRVELF